MADADANPHAHGGTGGAVPLRVALVVTLGIALFECAGGYAARSVALLADSAHVFMDAVALGIAVAAQIQARRPATQRRSFGYARLEVLAALANGGLLLGSYSSSRSKRCAASAQRKRRRAA